MIPAHKIPTDSHFSFDFVWTFFIDTDKEFADKTSMRRMHRFAAYYDAANKERCDQANKCYDNHEQEHVLCPYRHRVCHFGLCARSGGAV